MGRSKEDDEPLGKFTRDAIGSYLAVRGRHWQAAEREYRRVPTWLGVTYSLVSCVLIASMALAVVDGQHRGTWLLTLAGLMVLMLPLAIVEAVVRRKKPR